jgi:hypothetical protein
MATRFMAIEPPPPPAPTHSRTVLMADAQDRVCYYDDGGAVDLKDVIRRHCEQKQKERRDRGLG